MVEGVRLESVRGAILLEFESLRFRHIIIYSVIELQIKKIRAQNEKQKYLKAITLRLNKYILPNEITALIHIN